MHHLRRVVCACRLQYLQHRQGSAREHALFPIRVPCGLTAIAAKHADVVVQSVPVSVVQPFDVFLNRDDISQIVINLNLDSDPDSGSVGSKHGIGW